MALGRLAYKVGDRQASRTSQAGLADLLGVAVAQRRLGPSSSATTSTTERVLPSSAARGRTARRTWVQQEPRARPAAMDYMPPGKPLPWPGSLTRL